MKTEQCKDSLVVVVVEDDAVQQDIYRAQIAKMDLPIKLMVAIDGEEGVRAVRLHKPDLVIADLNMPGMDGFRLIREIRQFPDLGHTRIVAATGLDWPDIGDRGGLPSDVLVYEKPVPFVEIEALLREQFLRELGRGG